MKKKENRKYLDITTTSTLLSGSECGARELRRERGMG